MSILEYVIGGILLVLAIALIAIIGLQQSKRKSGLSGSIAGTGASESYLVRNKIVSKETTYKKITLGLAIAFVVLVLALYIIGSVEPAEDTNTSNTSATSSVAGTASATITPESSTAESSVESVAESSVESVAESSEASN